MADDRAGLGGHDTLARYPWMRLLRTFLVAVDPFKLLVAAAGILVASVGWWLISILFSTAWSAPRLLDYTTISQETLAEFPEETREENRIRLEAEGTRQYEIDRGRYLWKMSIAGPEGYVDAAGNPTEDGKPAPGGAFLPGGTFRHMPWTEKRGPNPYYLGSKAVTGTPEERRDTLADFYQYSAPNLVEPLIKYLRPIVYLSHPKASFGARIYLCTVILWTLLVWAFFGGIITRMAVLQFAGKEAGGLKEAVKFVSSRFGSYFLSPMVPLGIIAVVLIGSVVFGLVHMIPILGDLVDGLFWWIPLGFGFVMALLLAGLIGYPLMYPTLSAEGSDTFDALSRSYNYVYESPWSYLWYAFISIVYGAIVVFFVVLMASLTVYLGKWAVGATPFLESSDPNKDRSPEFLFIYSPTSFGWRELLTEGSPVAYDSSTAEYKEPVAAAKYLDAYSWYNYASAGMVGFWTTLFFMLTLGFGYSFFWCQSSLIYLLMRKKVDETEIDEVYVEEEQPEEPAAMRLAPPPAAEAPVALGTDRVPPPPSGGETPLPPPASSMVPEPMAPVVPSEPETSVPPPESSMVDPESGTPPEPEKPDEPKPM